MKWFLIIASFTALACSGISGKSKEDKIRSSPGSFAVLELFTSEGCSSCPPADNLLPQLAKLDDNIITLSFHVDYWDRLGWKDPFSSSEFTERQKKYGDQLHLESVYTPQLIINGQYEMVGSNRNSATQTIKSVLNEKAVVHIKINEVKKDANKLLVGCEAEGDLKKLDLIAALVQKQAVMKVKAGENNGATLSHTNVVRSFIKQIAEPNTSFTLNMPAGIADNNWRLIIYSQKKDGKITGAAVYEQ